MQTADCATKNVVWVTPQSPIDEAIILMEEFGIHHLPVVEDHRVVGMISDRDLLLCVGWRLQCERRMTVKNKDLVAGPRQVTEVMSQPAIVARHDEGVRRAAQMMVDKRISALPIISQQGIVAILTEADLLKKLQSLKDKETLLNRPVSEIMTRGVVTVKPKASLDDILQIFDLKHIRHVPVTVGQTLLGVISDRDIRRALGDSLISDAQAQQQGDVYFGPQHAMDVMSRNVLTVGPDTLVSEAIDSLLSNKIHSLPVPEEGALVGILTETDIVRAVANGEALAE